MGISNWYGFALLYFFSIYAISIKSKKKRTQNTTRIEIGMDLMNSLDLVLIKNKFRHWFNLIAIFWQPKHQPISSIPILFMTIISERLFSKGNFLTRQIRINCIQLFYVQHHSGRSNFAQFHGFWEFKSINAEKYE